MTNESINTLTIVDAELNETLLNLFKDYGNNKEELLAALKNIPKPRKLGRPEGKHAARDFKIFLTWSLINYLLHIKQKDVVMRAHSALAEKIFHMDISNLRKIINKHEKTTQKYLRDIGVKETAIESGSWIIPFFQITETQNSGSNKNILAVVQQASLLLQSAVGKNSG
ncbi:MAG: hypothetical protein WBP46_14950 [Thiolinea sp.]